MSNEMIEIQQIPAIQFELEFDKYRDIIEANDFEVVDSLISNNMYYHVESIMSRYDLSFLFLPGFTRDDGPDIRAISCYPLMTCDNTMRKILLSNPKIYEVYLRYGNNIIGESISKD